jgi:hypothetical protein
VRVVGPLVAFYDFPERKGEVQFHSSVPNTTCSLGLGGAV